MRKGPATVFALVNGVRRPEVIPLVVFHLSSLLTTIRRISVEPMLDPAQIRIDTEAQTLSIEWADGRTSRFPLDALRQACPCAECKGQRVEAIPPPDARGMDEAPSRRWTDLSIEPAGSVGIRISWDDGHNAGIYRWDRLRRLQSPQETG